MLKRLFNAMIVARQLSAAMQAPQYMSDSQLEDIGLPVRLLSSKPKQIY